MMTVTIRAAIGWQERKLEVQRKGCKTKQGSVKVKTLCQMLSKGFDKSRATMKI